MAQRIRVFAPATVANLGPGFDVLGLALPRPGDELEAELSDRPGVEIVAVTGDGGVLSTDPDKNVVGCAANDVLKRAGSRRGLRLWLHKQMPLASGLGSSGASSAAGAVAANELLGRPLTPNEVVLSAMEGERAASGSPHADNVAPSVLGGIVLVRSLEPLEVLSLPVPDSLHVVVVHPHCEVSTADARRLVKQAHFPLSAIVANLGSLASFVQALHRGDLALLGRSVDDQLIEPLRAQLIPGFSAVKKVAIKAGALGCSIAGSGPSVFAFTASLASAQDVGAAMQSAFRTSAGLESDLFAGTVSHEGARIV
ncbi:MAG: homoserine kinase [Vicinamibacterales bacterium]|nr:homoserine kinase [Vicinamibacterales bacterium]